jgi:TonB family protein
MRRERAKSCRPSNLSLNSIYIRFNYLSASRNAFRQTLRTTDWWHLTCLFLVGIISLAEEAEVGTRTGWRKRFFACATIAVLAGSMASAQQASMTVEEGKRKVKTRVNPAYPELARRMSIAGKVKIEVVIAPDGHIKSSRAVGGHPLLIQPCMDALKDWRFDPAPEETTQLVEFNFKD